MKTKSISQIMAQATRVREAYGYKTRGASWDYSRYMALARKVENIQARYIRNIGKHQRDAEGLAKDYQARHFLTISNIGYPREIYARISPLLATRNESSTP